MKNVKFQISNFKIQTQKGFTLIEILIAVAIIVSLLITAASIEIVNFHSGTQTKHAIDANNVTEETYALIRTIRDRNLVASPSQNSLPACPNTGCFPKDGKVYKFDNPNDPKNFVQDNNGDKVTVGGIEYTRKIYICDPLDGAACN